MAIYQLEKYGHPDFANARKPMQRCTTDDTPFSRGLVSFAPLVERSGSLAQNAVKNGPLYTKQSITTWEFYEGLWAQRNRVSAGNTDYYTSSVASVPATADFTVFMKLNKGGLAVDGDIWGQYDFGMSGRYYCYITAAGQVQVFNGSTTYSIGSTGVVPSSGWFTFFFTRTGTTVEVFINGASVGTATDSASIYQGIGTHFLGTLLGNQFRGYCSSFGVYQRALKPAEIRAMHRDFYLPLRPIVAPIYYAPTVSAPSTWKAAWAYRTNHVIGSGVR